MSESIYKKKSNEELIIDAKEFFNNYKKNIGESIRKGKRVVFIDFNDLSSTSPTLAEYLVGNPEETIQLLETALEELAKDGFIRKVVKNKDTNWVWVKSLSSVWQQVSIDGRTAKNVTDIVNAYLEAAEETEFEDPTKVTERAILILCDLYHNLMMEHMSLVDKDEE